MGKTSYSSTVSKILLSRILSSTSTTEGGSQTNKSNLEQILCLEENLDIMMNARNRECYAEVTEILQSKKLKDYIKLRLYILKMNSILYEEDVINYAALCLVETLRSGKKVPYPIAWAKVVSQRYISSQYDKAKSSEATDADKLEYWANCRAEDKMPCDETEEIRKKIKLLRPRNQRLLIWRFFKHLSWDKIAELLTQEEGIKISTVTARKRGARALDELRSKYMDESKIL
ncbi:sigma-70 family RNA polymerase sigma factor [Calothrix membranacea FACHB-236]|nr:sigma-70 family RNA polymerase sigma factor [Calothrix membranacea FACHB-236]